jgi:hypothetical protein
MAFKEVTTEQGEGAAAASSSTSRRSATRSRGTSSQEEEPGGQYTKPDDVDYSFLCKGADGKPVVKVLEPPPTDMKRKLAKADREGQLVQGVAVRGSTPPISTWAKSRDEGGQDARRDRRRGKADREAGRARGDQEVRGGAPPPPKPKSDDSLFGDAGGDDDIPF